MHFARILRLALLLFLATPLRSAVRDPTVRNVVIVGNLRIPASTILHHISVKPRSRLDLTLVETDVRKLHTLGLFRTIEVQTRTVDDQRIDLIFRVSEAPFVSGFEVRARNHALEDQIRDLLRRERLELAPATPYRPAIAHRAAASIRSFLRSHGFPNGEAQVREEPKGTTVRVLFDIDPGPKLKVGRIWFSGNRAISSGELRSQMQRTRRPAFWELLSRTGNYDANDLAADLEAVRRFYHSRGFATVELGSPRVETREFCERSTWTLFITSRKRQKIEIRIPVSEGPRYRLASVRETGDAGGAASTLIRDIPVPGVYDQRRLETVRERIESALGQNGYALAKVRLDLVTVPETRAVHATYTIEPGNALQVRKIAFAGNHRIPEKFLRRELVAREGELYDVKKLDSSLARLNRSKMVEEVRRSDVTVQPAEEGKAVDVIIRVREKDRQGIYGTGGLAGGGYLGILYTAFNLLGFGESWTLELDGGASQSNILLDIVGRHFLGSPFSLALSGFHRATQLNVATLVPGPEDIFSIFRSRSTGGGLAGAYEIGSSTQVGLGFELRRDLISILSADDQQEQNWEGGLKSVLSPSFGFDNTRVVGREIRGTRISANHAWMGSAFLKTKEATRQTFQYTRFVADPWTRGRNTFALHLEAGRARPVGDQPLGVTKRFFPGEEIVRGFQEGGLSPWTATRSIDGPKLAPSGADTVMNLSAEYRVPLRGRLSSAAFVDLGWARLDSLHLGEADGKRARLVEATNGVLRASMGGELRFQLPVIQQPGRLIFAWNPLRLEHWLQVPRGRAVRLADPRTALRFALGSRY